MQNFEPRWAWIVMISGSLYMLNFIIDLFVTIGSLVGGPELFGSISVLFLTFKIGLGIIVIWGMRKALKAIKLHKRDMQLMHPESEQHSDSSKKPFWPWIVIGIGGLLVVSMGPGVIMLPIMPLFLAGMSTDSGMTPSYVPGLIILVGYGLIIGYIILLVKAIRRLKRS